MIVTSVIKCNADITTVIIPRTFTGQVKNEPYGLSTESGVFDFSKVLFSTNIPNKTMKGSETFIKVFNVCNEATEECQFSPYCLSGNKLFPQYKNIYSKHGPNGTNTDIKKLFMEMTVSQFLKECKAQNCTLFDGKDVKEIKYSSNNTFLIDEPGSDKLSLFQNNQKVKSYIESLKIVEKNGTETTLSASDVCGALNKGLVSNTETAPSNVSNYLINNKWLPTFMAITDTISISNLSVSQSGKTITAVVTPGEESDKNIYHFGISSANGTTCNSNQNNGNNNTKSFTIDSTGTYKVCAYMGYEGTMNSTFEVVEEIIISDIMSPTFDLSATVVGNRIEMHVNNAIDSSGIKRYRYGFGQGTECSLLASSDASVLAFNNIFTNGTYNVCASVIDNAGNESDKKTTRVTVNYVQAKPTITTSVSISGNVGTIRVDSFTPINSDESHKLSKYYYGYSDFGNTCNVSSSGTTTTSSSQAFQNPGKYNMCVIAEDKSGNRSEKDVKLIEITSSGGETSNPDSGTNPGGNSGEGDQNPGTNPGGSSGGNQNPSTDPNANRCMVEFSMSDFNANKYTKKSDLNNEKLGKMLWIVEHSYPNLSVEVALQMIGVTLQEFKNEIMALDNTANSTNIDAYVNNYLYALAQYAIWYIEGYYEIDGSAKLELGNQITNNVVFNKIYQYYITNSMNKGDYASKEMTNTINIIRPEKELKESLNDADIYGPYTITSDALYLTKNIQLSIKAPNNGVTITDLSGKTITELTFNSSDSSKNQYLIKVPKGVDYKLVKVELKSDNAYVFKTSTRGLMLESESPIDQLVAVGNIVENKTITNEHDILYNPTTGLKNVVFILIVVTSVCVGGYLTLKHKGEPLTEL